MLTHLLQKAFEEAAKLPENEQDALAQWLLEEMESERRWDAAFAKSQDVLAKLAREAREVFHMIEEMLCQR